MSKKQAAKKIVETLTHSEAKRRNIPTAELESVFGDDERKPLQVAFERRNRDLDPQLVWRGKDLADWSDLVVPAPPLYIQEKVHPKVLIDDLLQRTRKQETAEPGQQLDLFETFDGLSDEQRSTAFYQHEANWTNRMILGDSLQVMASLAEREGLRGKVQCIYLDPPYGIKFNSNFQWSTTSRDVKDGKADHITREPEQVKAFRDTWRDGIHSYLTYLRDRLTVARELLTESGSIFVQIGDENVHRVRALMDEVFGEENFYALVTVAKTSGTSSSAMDGVCDFVVWYAKCKELVKYRQEFELKTDGAGADEYRYILNADGTTRTMSKDERNNPRLIPRSSQRYRPSALTSQRPLQGGDLTQFEYEGKIYKPGKGTFKTDLRGLTRLSKSGRLIPRTTSISYLRKLDDFPVVPMNNMWMDTRWGFEAQHKRYVVETNTKVLNHCLLMATDPGDLVLDPTCGSGTTAYVAEQWGRRWITIDTSRVALALARARIMGARYPYYLLADSRDGQAKEAEVSRREPSTALTRGDIRQGFVYERVPHITLKSIANNAEIDVIWDKYQAKLEPIRAKLNSTTKQTWEEWEIPREADDDWSSEAKKFHAEWWKHRISRQKEIDASIAAKADFEYLYDKPYEDKNRVRVAGPFTVESLSPHRSLAVSEDDEVIDNQNDEKNGDETDFAKMVLENLKIAGVQQAHKEDKITFTSLTTWSGPYICAKGDYVEGDDETGTPKRAGIFIGPEFGTVARGDLVGAAREASEAGFDVVVACAFNYDAQSTEFDKLGNLPILKARMNADLHMSDDLKNTGKGNLFVIFGEPDIDIEDTEDERIRVKINGVDVFQPGTGDVRSDDTDGIACWFIDTDYNNESFFVRHAYFLGANDPYQSLKTTLKAEINADAWATLKSDVSRPFAKPKEGRIAVKVINHLGDEVMKVFRVK